MLIMLISYIEYANEDIFWKIRKFKNVAKILKKIYL